MVQIPKGTALKNIRLFLICSYWLKNACRPCHDLCDMFASGNSNHDSKSMKTSERDENMQICVFVDRKKTERTCYLRYGIENSFQFRKKHQEWLSIELSVTCRMYYVINTVSPLPIAQRLLSQKPTGLSISDLKGKPETKTQQSMINEGKINFEPSISNVHETLGSLQLIKNFLRSPFASAPRTCLRSNSLKTEIIRRCQTIMRIKKIFYSSGCF